MGHLHRSMPRSAPAATLLEFYSGPHATLAVGRSGPRCSSLGPCSGCYSATLTRPIENGFAELKTLLREATKGTIEGIWKANGRIMDTHVSRMEELRHPQAMMQSDRP